MVLATIGLATAAALAVAWSPAAAVALGAWWAATALMVSWHLGLLETPDGRALTRLGAANLVTIGRSAVVPLLPFLTPVPLAAVLAIAALSDAIDGPLARRRGETSRLGRWLDASVDSLLLAAALLAAARLGLLSSVPLVLAFVRALLPWPVLFLRAFSRAQVPPVARVPFGRSSGFAIGAGIAVAALGVPEGGTVVAAGSILGLAGMAFQRIDATADGESARCTPMRRCGA